MFYRYIFLTFVGFCDAINIKGVKWGFRYTRISVGRAETKKKVLKLTLKLIFITYISGPNGVKKKLINLLKPTF